MTQRLGCVVLPSLISRQIALLPFLFLHIFLSQVEWDDSVSPTVTAGIRNRVLTLKLMWNMLSVQATDWKKNPSESQERQPLQLLKTKDLPEAGWKSTREKSDINLPVSTPKGYPQGTEHIVKEQGKFKTQSFANVTLKGIRKAEKKSYIFLNHCGKNVSTNIHCFGFFLNKVFVDTESPCLNLIFCLI